MNDLLKVSEIKQDATTQPRLKMDMSIVDEYSDAMKNGSKFPPLVVFKVDEEYVLADGYHRLWAAKSAGLKTYPCEIHEGTLRDAILYASGVNSTHGLRRTNEDKKRAVERLLADPEWGGWSDNKIAEICKVSPMTVGRYRGHTITLSSMDSPAPVSERIFTHHKTGKPSIMKTGNIGKAKVPNKPPKKEDPPADTKTTEAPAPDPIKTQDQIRKENMILLEDACELMLSRMPSVRFTTIIELAMSEFPGEFPTKSQVISAALDLFNGRKK